MTGSIPTPRASIVYESMFGNTASVAAAIADGLREAGYDVSRVDVALDPFASPHSTDLLVVGAPTHAFSLSRPNTRKDAVRQGAPPVRAGVGLREWLTTLPARRDATLPPLAVFDTRVSKVRRLPTAAGRTAARLARRAGFRLLDRPQGFLVDDVRGPLLAGELERATAWGRHLADAARDRQAQGPHSSGTKDPSAPASRP